MNAQDVEETVWRYLCLARLKGVTQAQQQVLTVRNDPRPVMSCVYEFYAPFANTNLPFERVDLGMVVYHCADWNE